MQSGKAAAWLGGGSALAVVALPLLLVGGVGGPAVNELCTPATAAIGAAGGGRAAGPDSRHTAGAPIDLPLAEADAAPPVPPDTIEAGEWTYPVPAPATITARFGETGAHWSRGHTGTDFALPAGTPVSAATDGVVLAVVDAGAGHAFGTYATVLHADNTVTVYAHLSAVSVTRG
ncbi:M23 family metallopeptidase [Streptomyces aculeolatus]